MGKVDQGFLLHFSSHYSGIQAFAGLKQASIHHSVVGAVFGIAGHHLALVVQGECGWVGDLYGGGLFVRHFVCAFDARSGRIAVYLLVLENGQKSDGRTGFGIGVFFRSRKTPQIALVDVVLALPRCALDLFGVVFIGGIAVLGACLLGTIPLQY